KVPTLVSTGLINISPNGVVTILIIAVILLFLGMIMDMAPLIVIATPIMLLVAMEVGMDPVHFGVLLILCLGIGLITPPVGAVLFVGSAIGKIPIEKATVGLLPFYVVMLVTVILVAYIPTLSLYLPDIFFG